MRNPFSARWAGKLRPLCLSQSCKEELTFLTQTVTGAAAAGITNPRVDSASESGEDTVDNTIYLKRGV